MTPTRIPADLERLVLMVIIIRRRRINIRHAIFIWPRQKHRQVRLTPVATLKLRSTHVFFAVFICRQKLTLAAIVRMGFQANMSGEKKRTSMMPLRNSAATVGTRRRAWRCAGENGGTRPPSQGTGLRTCRRRRPTAWRRWPGRSCPCRRRCGTSRTRHAAQPACSGRRPGRTPGSH